LDEVARTSTTPHHHHTTPVTTHHPTYPTPPTPPMPLPHRAPRMRARVSLTCAFCAVLGRRVPLRLPARWHRLDCRAEGRAATLQAQKKKKKKKKLKKAQEKADKAYRLDGRTWTIYRVISGGSYSCLAEKNATPPQALPSHHHYLHGLLPLPTHRTCGALPTWPRLPPTPIPTSPTTTATRCAFYPPPVGR